MEVISMLSGPVIGAVIGYFTNYIAVKMLFHPRNPITVGGHTLPFTPGIIPRRKKELAKAVGAAVQEDLFGEKEVKDILLADETQQVVAGGIYQQLESLMHREQSLQEMISGLTGSEYYEGKKEALVNILTDKIVQGIVSMDLNQVIADKGTAFVGEKLDNPLLAMFVTPEMIRSIATPVGEQMVSYVETEGREKIASYVWDEIHVLEQKQTADLTDKLEEHKTAVLEKLKEVYRSFVENHADAVVKQFRIQEIIEKRIADMSNEALENLVLSVMKHELGMIVNLGAVIGALIGVLNIFI